MTQLPDKGNDKQPEWQSSLPFPRRWMLYIVIKLAILAIAIFITLRIYGLV